jgi:hypothetical protein
MEESQPMDKKETEIKTDMAIQPIDKKETEIKTDMAIQPIDKKETEIKTDMAISSNTLKEEDDKQVIRYSEYRFESGFLPFQYNFWGTVPQSLGLGAKLTLVLTAWEFKKPFCEKANKSWMT